MVRMVVDFILPHAECGPNDHQKDAPPFIARLPNGLMPNLVSECEENVFEKNRTQNITPPNTKKLKKNVIDEIRT